jgi:DNA-binding response OmpR family regulator
VTIRHHRSRVPAGPRHVLVIEDESSIRAMLVDLLEDAGYAVLQAVDGSQALEQLRERRPDLIVLDLMLPGMSGWEFLERSRARLEQANIPVVVLSAIKGQGDYPATLGVGAWFSKPLDVPRFLEAVERMAGAPLGAAVPPLPEASSAPGPRILVVEDEPAIRDLVGDVLEEEGYTVEVAGSIDEALRRIREERPELLILDLMLPGRTGWTFLRERRADADLARIPVLVVSAAGQDRLLEAKEIGADGFLSKPFDVDVLSMLVRSFLN